MTESVRPPDPPLVDPETGETAPLSPRYDEVFFEGTAWLDSLAESDEWDEYERDISAHVESDDAA